MKWPGSSLQAGAEALAKGGLDLTCTQVPVHSFGTDFLVWFI